MSGLDRNMSDDEATESSKQQVFRLPGNRFINNLGENVENALRGMQWVLIRPIYDSGVSSLISVALFAIPTTAETNGYIV